jgi:DEAD/DEAH box helicase domain-containing protein
MITNCVLCGSPIVEVASLLAEMVQHGLRCLAFCNTRKLCELVHNYTREILKETAPALTDTIRAYRAGYTAHDDCEE